MQNVLLQVMLYILLLTATLKFTHACTVRAILQRSQMRRMLRLWHIRSWSVSVPKCHSGGEIVCFTT